MQVQYTIINTMRSRQYGRHFPDDILKWIFFNGNLWWILIKISLKFVHGVPIFKIPALVQIMACCQPGNKPLTEPMIVSLLMHICITRPQWVNFLALFCNWRQHLTCDQKICRSIDNWVNMPVMFIIIYSLNLSLILMTKKPDISAV